MNSLPAVTVARLQNQYEPVLRRVQARDVALLAQRPASGKWSIHEQLAHLGRYQEVFRDRLVALIRTPAPTFDRYAAADDPSFADWVQRPTETVIADLIRGRRALFKQLLIMTAEELDRTAHHPRYGRLDVAGWAEFFLLHEAHHLLAILGLLAELPASDA